MEPLPLIEVCAQCDGPRPCRCERDLGMLPKSRSRWRSKQYLKFIRGLPCSVPTCMSRDIEAAHFGPRAAGRKVHDCLAIPLCSEHHRDSHREGRAWVYYDQVSRWQLQTIVAAVVGGVVS